MDCYKNTRRYIDVYNTIMEKIRIGEEETTDEEDEFLVNEPLYLAHALLKDFGLDKRSRELLGVTADIINDVIRID